MDSFDSDELLASLGVEIPWDTTQKAAREVGCGGKAPPVSPKRHTEWNNNHTFEFGGYLAIVTQTTCECCGSMRERLDGIFTEEVKVGTGARRLQALAANGDWPVGGGHRCEVRQEFSRFCPDCVRALGFTKEMEAPKGRELVVR